MIPTADQLNAHLAAGGRVQVSTCLRSTLYGKPHVGWFTNNGKGELFVRCGRGRDCLAFPGRLLVSIRLLSR